MAAILPTKFVPEDFSLMGVAARILLALSNTASVSSLWHQVKVDPFVRTFDQFADALALLYALRLVDIRDGRLYRTQPPRLAI